MSKYIHILLAAILFVTISAEQYYLVTVKVDDSSVQEIRDHLESKGFDISGYNKETNRLEIITDTPRFLEKECSILQKRNILFEIDEIVSSESYESYSNKRDNAEDYYGPEQTLNELQQLEKTYPKWAKLFNLNEWLGLGSTVEGRSLYALQVSLNPDLVEDEAKIVIIGQHHARELMTHHAVLDSAKDYLKRAQQGDAKFLSALENSAVWFVPVVNPDGLAYVFSNNRMWRKNRARNNDGSQGVDLNRNYSFKWGACGSNSSNGSSDIFKGPSPQSESEVKVMDRLNAKLQAQYIISYHSSGDEVLYPYRCGFMAEANVYNDIRDRLANHVGFGKRVASSSGEDFEHHYGLYGSISFLLEIGSSFQPSFSTYENRVWPSVQKVLPFMLDELTKPHVHIKVLDKDTGKPLAASLSITEINFKEQEQRIADEHGSYRWRLVPGKYNLSIKMAKYKEHKIIIQAGGQKSNYFVELEK
ncbi:M14 family zinc carboxypeptidase [Candidatus Uabimicrobium sp. HlEnr_7]|uniref:M14 family zinc carboxypeptidase n=1 Tax=Candidatus Uabimicrobium helgolandensis TaxID=3095367 RepID=UPI00355675DA